jgi:hypothetical protein
VVTVADQQKKNVFCDDLLNDDFKILRKKILIFLIDFCQYIEVQLYEEKKFEFVFLSA